MYAYLNDIITQMKQAMALIGDSTYKIPLLCIVMYSNSDVALLTAEGKISKGTTIKTIAENYFESVREDLISELGTESIERFDFKIHAAVDPVAETSSIIMIVGTQIAMNNKKAYLKKQSTRTAVSNTQKQYLEDMKARIQKEHLNR